MIKNNPKMWPKIRFQKFRLNFNDVFFYGRRQLQEAEV